MEFLGRTVSPKGIQISDDKIEDRIDRVTEKLKITQNAVEQRVNQIEKKVENGEEKTYGRKSRQSRGKTSEHNCININYRTKSFTVCL